MQVVETIFPAFGFGDEAIRFVVILFAVGFIPVVVLAWVFEWTPEGVKVDDGDLPHGAANLAMARRWDRVVMVILAVAVAYFIVEKILWPPIEPEPIIAVLPLQGSELGPESQHLSTAIAEGIHVPLARIPQLVVSAWPTINRLAEDGLDDDQIVEALNAANSLRGSIELDGDRLQVAVRLVHTDSGRTIWQDSFDGTTAEIFDFQYAVIAAVVEELQLGATGGIYKARPVHPDAQRLTLQAWSALMRVNLENNNKIAAELLREALELDPDYIPALNAWSFTTYRLVGDGHMDPDDGEAIYREVQERAIAVDPEDGEQNAYNAWGLFWDDNEPAHANQHIQIALRTGLNQPEVLRVLAGFARRTGHADAAIWFGERAVAIDPTCENCVWQTTENLFYAGRFEEAIAAKERFQMLGGGGFAHHAYMLLRLGQPDAALEMIVDRESANPASWLALKAMAYHALGDTDKVAEIVAALEEQGNWDAQTQLAELYAFTGDIDLAFAALDAALGTGGRAWLVWQVFLPQWDNLRDDPRWTEVRQNVGMPEVKTAALDFSPVLQYTSRLQ